MYKTAIALWVALVAVAAAGAKTNYTITGDVSIGGFPRSGTLEQAIEVFGEPTSRKSDGYEVCTLSWRSSGVTMQRLYALGQGDPCGPESRHRSTTVTDERWKTARGLDIGDPLKELRKLYPKAQRDAPGTWRLTTRRFAGLPYPGLEATVKRGRVVKFTVYGSRSPF